jgi:hypothetical protein
MMEVKGGGIGLQKKQRNSGPISSGHIDREGLVDREG